MNCAHNTSNGSKRADPNRISTGNIGQPPVLEPGLPHPGLDHNPARVRASNMPMPKTWKTSSEAIRRIPTSSLISLAHNVHVGTAKAGVPQPVHGVVVTLSTKLT